MSSSDKSSQLCHAPTGGGTLLKRLDTTNLWATWCSTRKADGWPPTHARRTRLWIIVLNWWGLWSLDGMGPKRFVLSVDDDTEFRSRCEWIIPFYTLKYSIFPYICKKKKSRGGGSPPRMVRLETLFRALLDAPDRGISQVKRICGM